MQYYTEGNSYYSFVVTSVGVIGGTSGTSGSMGTSGTSGTGTAGTSGSSAVGTSGTSGTGTSGTSGTSGAGTAGTSGASFPNGSFGAVFDGSGGVITTNSTAYVKVPYGCTITGWEVVGPVSGTCNVDVYKNTPPLSGSWPPSALVFVAGASTPNLAAETNRTNASPGFVSGNTVTAGTWFRFTINTITSVTWVSVSIQVTKS